MTRIVRHVFVSTGVVDWRGEPAECRECPLPPDHQVHHMPETTPEQRATEARRLGEQE